MQSELARARPAPLQEDASDDGDGQPSRPARRRRKPSSDSDSEAAYSDSEPEYESSTSTSQEEGQESEDDEAVARQLHERMNGLRGRRGGNMVSARREGTGCAFCHTRGLGCRVRSPGAVSQHCTAARDLLTPACLLQ